MPGKVRFCRPPPAGAGKSEEIFLDVSQGSSVKNRATAGLMATTPLELAGGRAGRISAAGVGH